jgi:hypothetical protein
MHHEWAKATSDTTFLENQRHRAEHHFLLRYQLRPQAAVSTDNAEKNNVLRRPGSLDTSYRR